MACQNGHHTITEATEMSPDCLFGPANQFTIKLNGKEQQISDSASSICLDE